MTPLKSAPVLGLRLNVEPLECRLVPAAEFAAGTDRGIPASVRVFAADGAELFAAMPFGNSFTGGVRVATADFNLDGVADLAVGSGPGIPNQIHVLDGKTRAELFAASPFEAAYSGGINLAVGDLTGDGIADLVVSPDGGGGPRVDIYGGAGFARVASFLGIDDPNFRGGARTAVGDVDNDGWPDLVVAAGIGGGPRIATYDGPSVLSSEPVPLFNDFFAFEPSFTGGAYVAVTDLDFDKRAEILVGAGTGGAPRVRGFLASVLLGVPGPVGPENFRVDFFAGDPAGRGGVRIAVKDLNGSGRLELVAGSGTGGQINIYNGELLSSTPNDPIREFAPFPGFDGGVFVG